MFIDDKVDLKKVPEHNEKVLLNWKHNLGQGASAEVVEGDVLKNKLTSFAKQVSELLKIKFASIDIIETSGKFKILEINGGIMMEKFSASSPENYQIAKGIYFDAIKNELGL